MRSKIRRLLKRKPNLLIPLVVETPPVVEEDPHFIFGGLGENYPPPLTILRLPRDPLIAAALCDAIRPRPVREGEEPRRTVTYDQEEARGVLLQIIKKPGSRPVSQKVTTEKLLSPKSKGSNVN